MVLILSLIALKQKKNIHDFVENGSKVAYRLYFHQTDTTLLFWIRCDFVEKMKIPNRFQSEFKIIVIAK